MVKVNCASRAKMVRVNEEIFRSLFSASFVATIMISAREMVENKKN